LDNFKISSQQIQLRVELVFANDLVQRFRYATKMTHWFSEMTWKPILWSYFPVANITLKWDFLLWWFRMSSLLWGMFVT